MCSVTPTIATPFGAFPSPTSAGFHWERDPGSTGVTGRSSCWVTFNVQFQTKFHNKRITSGQYNIYLIVIYNNLIITYNSFILIQYVFFLYGKHIRAQPRSKHWACGHRDFTPQPTIDESSQRRPLCPSGPVCWFISSLHNTKGHPMFTYVY